MSRDRNFLGEFLTQQRGQQQQAAQAPQQAIQQSPIVEDENQGLIQALKTPAKKVAGVVPLPELSSREALAKSLLAQANDRNAHPLARGISAFFGAKTLQDIGAERGRTQEALAKADAEKRRLEREEDLAFKEREIGVKEEGVDVQRERIEAERQERAATKERQEKLDAINEEERLRKADIAARRLELDEQAAQNTIDEKTFKREQAKIDEEAAIVEEEAAAENSITLIETLLEHPGLDAAVGGTSIFPTRPGSDAADFEARFDQIKGEAFLSAFQKLKGGGTITETEGKKAESALARMQLSQSEKEFKSAAKEFKTTIEDGVNRKKAQAKKKGLTVEAPEFEGFKIRGKK